MKGSVALDSRIIGENVRFYRKERKLTQTELGNKAAMTQQGIGAIEKGKNMPPLDTLEALANSLDVSMSDLFYDANITNDLPIDFTPYYKARMDKESEEVQQIMYRALEACNNKMIVVLRLSKNEMDMYKIWNGDKKDAVRFWYFLDEYGVKTALDTPSDYAWCINKLRESNGNIKQVQKAWVSKLFKKYGLTYTIGMPHNVNTPWLCSKDYLYYLTLIGFIPIENDFIQSAKSS